MIVMLTLVVMVVLITRIETENPEMQMVKYSSRITGCYFFLIIFLVVGKKRQSRRHHTYMHAIILHLFNVRILFPPLRRRS